MFTSRFNSLLPAQQSYSWLQEHQLHDNFAMVLLVFDTRL
jgi:hypothetical protein